MTLPMEFQEKYANVYVPVKNFLSSYRALVDGKNALKKLSEEVENSYVLISDWKIYWIASCTLLRSSIDLFRQDKVSCFSPIIRKQIGIEWDEIGRNKEDHKIFWEFLRKERDSIIHHYNWPAYEVWLEPSGEFRPANLSILDIKPDDARTVLMMESGVYEKRDSIELLNEAADWVEDRIFGAIRRAGYSPDEHRNIVTFGKRPNPPRGLLGASDGLE